MGFSKRTGAEDGRLDYIIAWLKRELEKGKNEEGSWKPEEGRQ